MLHLRSTTTVLALLACGQPAAHPLAAATQAAPAGAATAPDSSTVLATYSGGSVDRETYASWARARWADPSVIEPAEVVTLASTLLLAARAPQGDDEEARRLRFLLSELDDALLAAELRRRIAAQVDVSEGDIDALIAADPTWVRRPERRKLRNLTKRVDPDADPATRRQTLDRMQALRAELAAGAEFATLAERESDSESRIRGGRIGLVSPGQLDPSLERVAFALRAGELSPVLETPDGYVLLYCEGVVPAQTVPLSEARAAAREAARRDAAERQWEAVRAELLAQAAPRYELGDEQRAISTQVLVRFDDGSLTGEQLGWLLEEAPDRPALQSAPEPRLRAIAEQLVTQVMAARRARAMGLGADPTALERRHWRRHQLMARATLRAEARSRFTPPRSEEMAAYFATNAARFIEPERFHLALIRWPGGGRSPRQQMESARTTTARIRAGERAFADVARTESDHPSAAAGGEIGWLTRRQLAGWGPELFAAATKLEPGEISDPVRRTDGVFVVQLLAHREQRPLAFDEATPLLVRLLTQRQLRSLEATGEREARAAVRLYDRSSLTTVASP